MKRWPILLLGLAVVLAAGAYVVGPTLLGQGPKTPAAAKELTSYRDLVKQVLPAVVSIEARSSPIKVKQSPRRNPRFEGEQSPDDPRKQLPEEFRRFFEEMPFGPLDRPTPKQGFGSGFLIDAKGTVLTNFHVVDGANQVTIELQDGRKFVSRDIKGDRRSDLAIVRLNVKDGKALPFLELGDSDQMEIGDRVLAVGAPFGLTGTVTQGIVSGKGRNGFNMNMYEDFLQTDAAINPGNSGGPLVNLEGKVIGINSAIKSRTGGFQGVGLAIASNLAKNIVNALVKDGVVHRGYLGVQIRDLPTDVASHLGLKDKSGVVVGQVFDDSPAAKAGMLAGDVITAINGKIIKDGRVLQATVAGLPLNKSVPVAVIRDGKTQELSVTILEQPGEFGLTRPEGPRKTPQEEESSVGVDKIGVDVADLTPRMRDEFGYKNQARGVLITRVDAGSVAWEAGLRQGMLIGKVNNQRVESATAARDALQHASLKKGILLQVQSPQGGTNYVLLQQGRAPAGG
jgi:serine protease Do